MTDLIPQQQIKDARLFNGRDEFIKVLPKKISYVEAGPLAGDFALNVINTINPKKAYLVEPYYSIDWRAPEFDGPRWNGPEEHFDFVKNRFMDIGCATIIRDDFESFALKSAERFDFVYCDYDTSYISITKQIKASIKILNDNGIIGFNDYSIYHNNTKTGEKMGVVPAINQFLRKNPNWHVYAFALNDNLTSDIYLKRS